VHRLKWAELQWVKVQAFISESPTCSIVQRKDDLPELDELFDPVKRSMHLPLADLCPSAKLYDESPDIVASVCSMSHLSRLLVHASMVPALSGRSYHPKASQESVRGHNTMVLRQAIEYVKLLLQFMESDLKDIVKKLSRRLA
jgi:hypothetical protein